MPCGPRARLVAYVAYRALAFSERDVLIAALANLYKRIEAQELAREKVKQEVVSTAGYWRGIALKLGGIAALIGLIVFMLWYFATGLGK